MFIGAGHVIPAGRSRLKDRWEAKSRIARKLSRKILVDFPVVSGFRLPTVSGAASAGLNDMAGADKHGPLVNKISHLETRVRACGFALAASRLQPRPHGRNEHFLKFSRSAGGVLR